MPLCSAIRRIVTGPKARAPSIATGIAVALLRTARHHIIPGLALTTCTPNTAPPASAYASRTGQRHHISASDTLTSLSSAPCAPIAPRTPFLIAEKKKRKKQWPRPVRPSPTSKIATATSGYTSAATRHQVPPGGLEHRCLSTATHRDENSQYQPIQKKHTTPPRAAELATGPISSSQQPPVPLLSVEQR